MVNNIAIILAAGRGMRAGAGLPKTYRDISGIPIIRKTITCFLEHPEISQIQLVIHPDDVMLFQNSTDDIDILPAVFGGETRALSVVAGLEAISKYNPDNVLIHDGARPNVSAKLISDVIAQLEFSEGAIPALPVVDALWQSQNHKLIAPVDRANLIRAQTPQGFRFHRYFQAVSLYPNALDDAEIAVKSGLDVAWVDGDALNVKMTFPSDFES